MIHNTCNMAMRDLPDMYALSPQPLGFEHTYQANPSRACYNHYKDPNDTINSLVITNK